MNSDNRNSLIAIVVFIVLFGAYEFFIALPAQQKTEAARKQAAAAQQVAPPPSAPVATFVSRQAALAGSGARVPIQTGTLQGSISLRGARIDDLFLSRYRETVEAGSPPVDLLRPSGTKDSWYVTVGWRGDNLPGMPDINTAWTQTGGTTLSAGHPVTLRYVSPGGVVFDRTIAIDAQYMFTITDKVTNQGAVAVALTPASEIRRDDIPPTLGSNNIVHEGGIGMLGGKLIKLKYADWKKSAQKDYEAATGWMGVTDKYWMTILIPPAGEAFASHFAIPANGAVTTYSASYAGQAVTVAPGTAKTFTTRLFAGPKVRSILNSYADVPRFEDAIDWGFALVITKPIHWLLEFFNRYVSLGVAILMLTVVIRLIMFPLANRGYEMSVKMKKLAPLQKELQERHKDDPQEYQKQYMALLQREKLNPVTGCLPLFLQIPVFYSLTKVFTVAIDLRHTPFGWVHDLSAPDQTTIFNLFGLIPWDVFHTDWVIWAIQAPFVGGIVAMVLHLGVWPIAYGVSMFVSQAMTPQQGIDPTQQMIFKLMPIVFTFILSQYAVGLLIYWTWSGAITVLQTYILMRRYKVDNPIDEVIRRITGRPKPADVS